MSILVRALLPEDVPSYRRLMLEAYATETDVFVPTVEERTAEPVDWWIRRVCDPVGFSQAFGAFQAGSLIGGVVVEFANATKLRHKARLVGMYVSRLFRGHGAGRLLLDTALAHAQVRPGVRVVTLTVAERNEPAVRLYGYAGFQVFGVEPMAFFTGKEYVSVVYMQRPFHDPLEPI